VKKKKRKRSLARFALGRATRLFLFRQVFSTAASLAGNYLEKQYGPQREQSYAYWQDRIHALNLLLDTDPAVRDKITRLTAWLYQQNRHDDLRSLQQFLLVLDEPPEESPMTKVWDAISGFLSKSSPVESHETSERILFYLAGLIGDSGTEGDFTAAVSFLEAHRIIGLPAQKTRRGTVSAKIADQLKNVSGSLEKASSWFQKHTRGRRRSSLDPAKINPEA
jgi:hypothetical protein